MQAPLPAPQQRKASSRPSSLERFGRPQRQRRALVQLRSLIDRLRAEGHSGSDELYFKIVVLVSAALSYRYELELLSCSPYKIRAKQKGYFERVEFPNVLRMFGLAHPSTWRAPSAEGKGVQYLIVKLLKHTLETTMVCTRKYDIVTRV